MPLSIAKLRKPTFKAQFEKTGDMHFAVMAIGEKPDDPPTWALQACKVYLAQRQVEVESPGRGRPPRYSVEDGLALEVVATLMVENGLSATAAVKEVTQQESDGTDFRRLMRIWKRHLKPELMFVEGGKPKKTNKWLDLAHKRESERWQRECFERAQAEIEAGNLSIDIDPEDEAERLKHAKWFRVCPDPNHPEESALFRIAPTSKKRMVAEVKRLLLERKAEEG